MAKQLVRVRELSGTCARVRAFESVYAFERPFFNMNFIRKHWKPRYIVAWLEFVQECLLYAVVESNKQVRWLKYAKDGYKNDENVDTLRGFCVCHETKVLTIIIFGPRICHSTFCKFCLLAYLRSVFSAQVWAVAWDLACCLSCPPKTFWWSQTFSGRTECLFKDAVM